MRWLLASLAGLIAALVLTVVGLLATAPDDFPVRQEAVRALVGLVTAVAVTGVLSFVLTWMIAERNREHERVETERARGEERERVLLTALAELKSGHEQAYVARLLLRGHPTGYVLAEQLPRLLDARAHLQRVQRERFVPAVTIRAVQDMLDLLRGVAEDFSDNYLQVTEAALREAQARAEVAAGTTDRLAAPPPLPAQPFARLHGFIAGGPDTDPFHRAYLAAKAALRAELGVSPVTVPAPRSPAGVTRTAGGAPAVT